ncbi:periplasmic heavy metal sensor [bacterium]|nr:periplasmic heavy metal sensor [bacterium]
MKTKVLIGLVLAMILCMTPVWCQQGGPRQGGVGMSSVVMTVMPPQANMIDRLAEQLDLTEDQVSSLKTVLTEGNTTVQSLQKTSSSAAQALRKALFASTYDADAVADAAAKAEKAEAAVVTASINVWVQIREVLTADQITALQSATTFSGGPGGPGGQGRPGGPPPDGSSTSGGQF